MSPERENDQARMDKWGVGRADLRRVGPCDESTGMAGGDMRRRG